MKKRLISVLVFALAVSAGAAFVLYQLISSRVKAGTTEKPKTTTVFVANRDLEAGALVQEKDIKSVEYLSVPNGAITRKENIVGRGVTNPIHQDGPFFETGLAAKGGGAGFAVTIPVGMRACAVRVNEVMGVAGFAVAGMHVDVLVSGTAGNSMGAGDTMTRTLLQDVLVLSAGQNYQKDGEGKPFYFQVVNLLVTPAQAEMLYLATDQKIQLVLRNPADHSFAETRGVHQAELFLDGSGRPLKPSPAITAPRPQTLSSALAGTVAPKLDARTDRKLQTEAPAGKKVTVEVYSGQKRSEATFEQESSGVNP
jgi:pilus assembly protein CpaB